MRCNLTLTWLARCEIQKQYIGINWIKEIDMTKLRKVARTGYYLCVLTVFFSFFPDIHRSAVSLSFLAPFFLALALVTALSFDRIARKAFAMLLVVGLTANLLWYIDWDQEAGPVSIYSKNLRAGPSGLEALSKDILELNPDVVALQEFGEANAEILDLLKARYPYQHICQFTSWSGIAILTRHPVKDPPKCSRNRAAAAVKIVIGENQPVWFVSLHIAWPWPMPNGWSEDAALELIGELDGQIVLAGDFNAFPWSSRVSQIARLSKSRVVLGAFGTRPLFGVPLPIDLALSRHGGVIEKRPLFGSDHNGVFARINLS